MGREPLGLGAARPRPLASGGPRHGDRDRLRSARRRPQQADLHLQPFPGSDAALAFAMLHVIVRDGLVDRELLEQHSIGWDELEPQLERVHAGVGGAGHRRAGAADRAGGRDLRPRAVAALDRSGPAAPAHRRQRDAGGGAAAGGERQPGQARSRVPVPERSPRDRRGLAGGAAAGRSAGADQPHGPGRPARGSGAQPQPVLLEHQHRRVQPRADQAAGRARPRRPVHGGGRPVRDRHGRLRRPAAAGGQLPGVRRPGRVVLRSVVVGTGEGGRPGRRGAAQPGDLPPAGDRDGLHRAGAARRRPRADRRDAGPVRRDRELRAAGGGRARCR